MYSRKAARVHTAQISLLTAAYSDPRLHTLAMQHAVCRSLGRPFLGRPTTPQRALYWSRQRPYADVYGDMRALVEVIDLGRVRPSEAFNRIRLYTTSHCLQLPTEEERLEFLDEEAAIHEHSLIVIEGVEEVLRGCPFEAFIDWQRTIAQRERCEVLNVLASSDGALVARFKSAVASWAELLVSDAAGHDKLTLVSSEAAPIQLVYEPWPFLDALRSNAGRTTRRP
jgi:hypothetical protein